MRILLITSQEEDYLQDSIIHGFKQLFGKNAIDYPTKSILYNDYENIEELRGKGFTLYGLLSNNLKNEKIINVEAEIISNKFDLIVFTSIYRQYHLFYKYYKLLKKSNARVWIIDGEDTSLVFPSMPKHLKKFILLPKPYNYFTYYKRELGTELPQPAYLKFSGTLSKKIARLNKLNTISFSIPTSKIVTTIPKKIKLFGKHIVDEEVADKFSYAKTNYIFDSETEYYQDLRSSKFGITTKRAGWDCMRHYEIAANGCVICFKNLDQKPFLCAPHGLVDGKNCIVYTDYDNLKNKLNSISEIKYKELLNNSLNWVKANTTVEMVKRLLKDA